MDELYWKILSTWLIWGYLHLGNSIMFIPAHEVPGLNHLEKNRSAKPTERGEKHCSLSSEFV